MQKYDYFSTLTNLNTINYKKKAPTYIYVGASSSKHNQNQFKTLIEFEIVTCIIIRYILHHT